MAEFRRLREGNRTNRGNGGNVNNANQRSKHKCCKIIIVVFIFCAIIATATVLTITFMPKDSKMTNPSTLCLWNATNASYVNGLYSSIGTSRSGYPMYSLPMADSCNFNGSTMYLFNSMESIWTISSLKDDTSSSGLQGICTSNTITNVTKCNGLWQIPRDKPQRDVMSMGEQCPSVHCKSLQLSYDEFITNESCIGIFQNKISDNLYQKGTSDLYLFFNPSIFRWGCGDKKDIDGCVNLDALDGYAVDQSWYNAHHLMLNGENISMPWSNGHQATIKCLTTGAPTMSPSNYPTISPTKSPTKYPTFSPTRNPTWDGVGRIGLSGLYIWLFVGYVFALIA